MEYNSQREKLILPEFGRNVQKMVEFTIKIEDREERLRAAKSIIQVMAANTPMLNKDQEDFYHKLWDHLYVISNYQLDVDGPYEKPKPEDLIKEKKKITYPNSKSKYKHYGKIVETFIKKAKDYEDPIMKDKFTEAIANMMKKAYLIYNRDSVNDELIKNHLLEMSDGNLKFKEHLRLSSTNEILGNPNQRHHQNNHKKKKKKFNNNNNNNNNQNNNQHKQQHMNNHKANANNPNNPNFKKKF